MTMEERKRLLVSPQSHVDVVIDSDAFNEVDDQFAIAYALRSKEAMTVKALYAAPFVNEKADNPADGMEKSYAEMLRLLDLAHERTPVLKGSPNYLPDEQTAVDSPAAQDLARRAMAYDSEHPLYVVSIGAITNVASALLLNPEIAERIVVIWTGGNRLDWPDAHEFNMEQDVAAARVVFDSGAPLVLLPAFGVVSAFATTGPELEYWMKGKNPLCDYLCGRVVEAANSYAAGKPWSRVIWDVTAVAWLLNGNGEMMYSRLEPTPIPEYDHHYTLDPGRLPFGYVYHINRDPIFEDMFHKLAR